MFELCFWVRWLCRVAGGGLVVLWGLGLGGWLLWVGILGFCGLDGVGII